ncbi:MAG: acetyl-CoA C-acyltransferase, partial [Verrucomicrobiae bacterium]|nr:acetyl-CoA C-acyltransferase [Verrucomicrobiae bacterium]
MKSEVFLAGSARTPLGSFCSAFGDVTAVQLGITAVKAAVERSGIQVGDVDEVYIGNILSGGLKPNAARQISIGAGLGDAVPATTLNMLCGSGMKAIMIGAQSIQCGDNNVVVAGGIENMSRAPYLLESARTGYRMGHGEIYDSLLRDALLDAFDGSHMGTCGDKAAARYGFTREDQDTYAIQSYKRAQEAIAKGYFKSEIAPHEIIDRRGNVTVVDTDEEPARFNEEKFVKLRPAFGKDGTVTAGNASSINDGASAIIVLSAEKAKAVGIKPEARILGYAQHAHEPEWFTLAPIHAVKKLMEKLDWTPADVDLFE